MCLWKFKCLQLLMEHFIHSMLIMNGVLLVRMLEPLFTLMEVLI